MGKLNSPCCLSELYLNYFQQRATGDRLQQLDEADRLMGDEQPEMDAPK